MSKEGPMQFASQAFRRSKVARYITVSLMLVLWLATAALAVSPDLHHLLHHDAQSLGHDCLVTHLSKGELLISLAAAFGVTIGLFLQPFFFRHVPFSLPEAGHRHPPGRAPPALLPV